MPKKVETRLDPMFELAELLIKRIRRKQAWARHNIAAIKRSFTEFENDKVSPTRT